MIQQARVVPLRPFPKIKHLNFFITKVCAIYFFFKVMTKNNNKRSLNDLLYVEDKNDIKVKKNRLVGSDDENNIHIYSFQLIFDLLKNPSEMKKCKYYTKCPAFKAVCKDITKHLPKDIFVKDEYGDWKVDTKHKDNILFEVYNHAIQYMLKELGF